jgi:DNA-binding PadR family transcriptional regulator
LSHFNNEGFAVSRAIKLRDLVVLGLLREHPRYGYEIKMIIDHVMSHVIDVSSGSLYYGLKKLEERGLVQESAVEKVGRRPERSVYSITEEGNAFFADELPRVIFPQARPFFPLDLALYFFQFISAKEQARRLKMRKEYLQQSQSYLDDIAERFQKIAPRSHVYIVLHLKNYIVMEQQFIEQLLRELADHNAYQLDERDWREIKEELEEFKQRVRYETVSNGNGHAVAAVGVMPATGH